MITLFEYFLDHCLWTIFCRFPKYLARLKTKFTIIVKRNLQPLQFSLLRKSEIRCHFGPKLKRCHSFALLLASRDTYRAQLSRKVVTFFERVLSLNEQRWSPRGRPWPQGRPRGHILKSLASKVKSLALASRPQVLKNWPVLGSRTAVFFELLKFCGALEKFFWKTFFCGDRLKNFCEDLFFFEIA